MANSSCIYVTSVQFLKSNKILFSRLTETWIYIKIDNLVMSKISSKISKSSHKFW